MDMPDPDYRSILEQLFSDKDCNNMEIAFLTSYFGLNKSERKAFCELIIKMFPGAISKIVKGNPLDKPYGTDWEEDPALMEAGEESNTDRLPTIDDDEEAYANFARNQRRTEKKQAAQVSSAKESGVG